MKLLVIVTLLLLSAFKSEASYRISNFPISVFKSKIIFRSWNKLTEMKPSKSK